ncbi:MAG TPA: MFS transporter [Beijerinckiaceae bacterium]|nr:MFS transporter [Beijerinckiaceae bacterium]
MTPRIAWAIAGLGVTQIVSWGSTYYLLTVMGPPIAADLGLPPEFVAFGQSLMLITSGLLGPLAGRIMDTRGARPVMTSGSLVSAGGLGLLALARDPFLYLVACLVVGISGAMVLYSAAFTALTQLDPARARRNITLLTLPGGLASTVFWPLGTWLLTHVGWREVCLIYAMINVLLCLPIHVLVAAARGKDGRLDAAPATADVEGLPKSARQRAFLLLATMLALQSLATVGLFNQILTFLTGLGHSQDLAIRIAMLFGASQVSARVFEMLFGGRYEVSITGVVAAFGLLAAMLVLPLSTQVPAAGYVFAALLGASNGLFTIVQGALTVALFGSRGYGARIGSISVARAFTSALGPVLFAAVLARIGAWGLAVFCIVVSTGVLVVMLMLFQHIRRHAQDRTNPGA